MMVRLSLSDSAETELRQRAAETGIDVERFVLEAVEEKLAAAGNAVAEPDQRPLPNAQWIDEFRRWIASHPAHPFEADDSRESIYAGRGE